MSAAPHSTRLGPRPRDGYVWLFGLLLALAASLLLHATLLISALRGGAMRGTGEAGHEGAGDMTVDISVAAPPAPTPNPALAEPQAPPAPPTPPPEVSHTPAAVVSRPHTPEPTTPTEPADPAAEQTVPEASPEVAAADPAPPHLALDAHGTGAEVTSGGRSPGLPDDALRSLVLGMAGDAPTGVESQRALLPAATTCEDPVAGVWRAFKYSPFQEDWVRFTLVIHRHPDGTLEGTITSRIWTGGPSDRTPPACEPGMSDYTTRMPAHGRVDDHLRVTFTSTTSETIAVHCADTYHSYAPDNFSGTIDPARQEFQSVNNDGAFDVNSPYVFRRTGCVDE